MKILIVVFTVSIFFSCSTDNSPNNFLLFEIRLAEHDYSPKLKEINLYNSNEKFFVYDSVYLKNSDIEYTRVSASQTTPQVIVFLNDKGREKFADFTKNNVGKIAAMIVDNKLVCAPRINAQIREGKLIITGFITQSEASKIADGILPKD